MTKNNNFLELLRIPRIPRIRRIPIIPRIPRITFSSEKAHKKVHISAEKAIYQRIANCYKYSSLLSVDVYHFHNLQSKRFKIEFIKFKAVAYCICTDTGEKVLVR